MKLTRIVVLDLLCYLPAKDRNEFARYLKSDFFNRSESIRQLNACLGDFAQREEVKVNKAELFAQLFPQELTSLEGLSAAAAKNKVSQKLDPLLYRLKHHLNDYLIWKQGKQEGFSRGQLLLQAYYQLNAEGPFLKKCKEVLASLDENDRYNSDYHLRKYLVMRMRYYQFSRVNLDVALTEKRIASHHLDSFFIIQTLTQSYSAITRNLLHNDQQKLPFLENVLQQAIGNAELDGFYPSIFLPLLEGMMQGKYDPEYFERICRIIPENIEEIPQEEQFGIYKILLDYYLFLEQFTWEKLPQNFFELVEEGIAKGYLVPNGKLSYLVLLVYVRTAAKRREFEKAEILLEQFKDQVQFGGEPGVLTVPYAYLRFARADFKGALRILHQNKKPKYLFDKILERLLLLQCYYETGEVDLLENCLESSRKFISRLTEVGPIIQHFFGNFLTGVKKLSTHDRSGEYDLAWVEELANNRTSLEQDWLLAMAQRLMPLKEIE